MRRRTASYRLRPDHKAAVAALANDNSTGQGETVEELVEREARARYGANWREIVRVRVEGNGAYLEAVSTDLGRELGQP
jgi:hypothetical protein